MHVKHLIIFESYLNQIDQVEIKLARHTLRFSLPPPVPKFIVAPLSQ